jgi:hypothetical protein
VILTEFIILMSQNDRFKTIMASTPFTHNC